MLTSDALTATLVAIIRTAGFSCNPAQTEALPESEADARPQLHSVVTVTRTGDWLAMRNTEATGEQMEVVIDIRTGDCAQDSVDRLRITAAGVWDSILSASTEQLAGWKYIQVDEPSESLGFSEHTRSLIITATFRVLIDLP